MNNLADNSERFLFLQASPDRYDYQKINSSQNKDSVVDTGTIFVDSASYDPAGQGISFDLSQSLQTSLNLPEKQVRGHLYEMLDAMDEELTSNPPGNDEFLKAKGLDGLDDYLKANSAAGFSIFNGYITFKSANGTDLLKLPVISSRQEELRRTYYEGIAEVRSSAKTKAVDLATQAREQEVARLHQELVERRAEIPKLPPPDNGLAVSVDLPLAETPIKYSLPKRFWIRSDKPPKVLTGKYEEGYYCKMHVGAMLKRELPTNALRALGYVEGKDRHGVYHEAWHMRRDFVSKDGGEVVSDIGRHLYLVGGSIWESGTHSESYIADLEKFREGLDGVNVEKDPLIMGLFFRGSHYKAELAQYNMRVEPKYRSFNTHITYCLGKGFRKLDTPPIAGEHADKYVARSLGLKPEFVPLLKSVRIRVDGKICTHNGSSFVYEGTTNVVVLKSSSEVELEDYWFSHHFGGSKISSLTEFFGNGQFVPTYAMRLKTEKLVDTDLSAPKIAEEDALKQVDSFTLRKGQKIRDAFEENVSLKPEDWDLFAAYLKRINFDTKKVLPGAPIPVPDMDLLRRYHEQQNPIVYKLPYTTVPDPLLEPVSVIYLRRGQNLHTAFVENVSEGPEDWKFYRFYLRLIGSRDKEFGPTAPAPVPDMISLRKYIEKQGGFAQLLYEETVKSCDSYNESHPGEHLLAIPIKGANRPWDLVGNFFDGMTPPASQPEIDYILGELDALNPTIDLRMRDSYYIKDGEIVEGKDYANWQGSNYLWISDEVVSALKFNVERQRILDRTQIPSTLTITSGEQVEISDYEKGLISNATSDPQIQMELVFILINEDKRGGARRAISDALDKTPLFDANSLGLFRVRPVREDLEYVKKFGYDFGGDFEKYREALISDDVLNVKIAAYRADQNNRAYRHLLAVNGEPYSKNDVDFISASVTCYNRPSGHVFAGAFGIMAQKISDSFSLGLDSRTFEKPHKTRTYLGIKSGTSDKIYGEDTEGISNFFDAVAKALINNGIVNYTQEQQDRDYALFEGKITAEAFYQNPVSHVSSLIRNNKEGFLRSELYAGIKKASAERGLRLSLLPDSTDYESTAVFNYGYSATRHAFDEIRSYSDQINSGDARRLGYADSKNIYELQSVRNLQEMPLAPIVTKDLLVAESQEWPPQTPTKSVIPATEKTDTGTGAVASAEDTGTEKNK